MSPSPRRWPLLLALAAVLGLFFTGFSTYDFALYLDRQVHGLHCSFIPGLGGTDVSGTSGCHVTLMSPYSSVLRRLIWGGLPVSLPGMAVFSLLLYRALDLVLRPQRAADPSVTGVVLGLSLLPVAASVVMGAIALVVLDAACKLCIGTYAASFMSLAAAIGVRRQARRARADLDEAGQPLASPLREALIGLGQLLLFLALPTAAWAALLPDHDAYIGTCGELIAPGDVHGIFIDLDPPSAGATPAIELLDPLCPACKALEQRLAASGHADSLQRQAVLFPLDAECNWMVGATLHPGACTISEAALCAEGGAPEVIDWAFAHSDEIRQAAADDPEAAAAMVVAAFPDLAGCVGRPAVRAKLNHSLRWAVKNKLSVLTPQLFIDGRRVCDADTDLGLDYALATMLEPTAARGDDHAQ